MKLKGCRKGKNAFLKIPTQPSILEHDHANMRLHGYCFFQSSALTSKDPFSKENQEQAFQSKLNFWRDLFFFVLYHQYSSQSLILEPSVQSVMSYLRIAYSHCDQYVDRRFSDLLTYGTGNVGTEFRKAKASLLVLFSFLITLFSNMNCFLPCTEPNLGSICSAYGLTVNENPRLVFSLLKTSCFQISKGLVVNCHGIVKAS
ncbi:hypothetical protein VNO77_37539 [Canavalia gladiata]|uniref:Uncharacterized protein n=1 Tax=Canavalia gladiata TaxID=3824 RepID=A0AAN9PUU2_CANGL